MSISNLLDIQYVTSASYTRNVDGEDYLEFETLNASSALSFSNPSATEQQIISNLNQLQDIALNNEFSFDGRRYYIDQIEQRIGDDGIPLLSATAKHVSYRLSKVPFIEEAYRGGHIYKIDDEFVVNGARFRVTGVTSKNVPSVEIVDGGSGFSVDDVLTYETGIAQIKMTVSKVGQQGQIEAVIGPYHPNDENDPNAKQGTWSVGVAYPQTSTSGDGSGYTCVCTSVMNSQGIRVATEGSSGYSPTFANGKRGSGYKVGDQIVCGSGTAVGAVKKRVSTSVNSLGWWLASNGDAAYPDAPNSTFVRSCVASTSGFSEGASDIVKTDKYGYSTDDVYIDGTPTYILTKILEDNATLVGDFGVTQTFRYSLEGGSIREIVLDFMEYLHKRHITNKHIVFDDNNGVVFVSLLPIGTTYSLAKYNIEEISVKKELDKKESDGTYTNEYTCKIVQVDNIALGDIVYITGIEMLFNGAPSINLQVTSITYNPFLADEKEISVSNIVKEDITKTIYDMNRSVIKAVKRQKSLFNTAGSGTSVTDGGSSGSSGGGLGSFDSSQAGDSLSVDNNGNVVTTPANDNLDPMIVNQLVASAVSAAAENAGVLHAAMLEAEYLGANSLAMMNTATSNGNYIRMVPDGIYSTSNAYKPYTLNSFVLAYGGSGYVQNEVVTVYSTPSGSGPSASVTVTGIANGVVQSFVDVTEAGEGTTSAWQVDELVVGPNGFKGIVRTVKNGKPVISMLSGGSGYAVNDSSYVQVTGASSGAITQLRITSVRSGVATAISYVSNSVNGTWNKGQLGMHRGSGNKNGLLVYASGLIGESDEPEQTDPEIISECAITFAERNIKEVPADNPNDTAEVARRVLSFVQRAKPQGGTLDAINYPLDLSGATLTDDAVNVLGLKKVTNNKGYKIGWTEGFKYKILSHIPTQDEANSYSNGTIVFVYDPSIIIPPSDSSDSESSGSDSGSGSGSGDENTGGGSGW